MASTSWSSIIWRFYLNVTLLRFSLSSVLSIAPHCNQTYLPSANYVGLKILLLKISKSVHYCLCFLSFIIIINKHTTEFFHSQSTVRERARFLRHSLNVSVTSVDGISTQCTANYNRNYTYDVNSQFFKQYSPTSEVCLHEISVAANHTRTSSQVWVAMTKIFYWQNSEVGLYLDSCPIS